MASDTNSAKHSIRLLLVGHNAPGALELSYRCAFADLGCQVELFNLNQAVRRHVRLGRLGHLFNTFVPVEPWIRGANRELLKFVMMWRPHILMNVAQYPVRAGTLAQIKASTPARLVHLWPDTLMNWNADLSACVRLYDLVATYSKTTIPVFQRMGAQRVEWVPLAGDPSLHSRHDPEQIPHEDRADVSFVGGWRPEREAILSQLGGFNLKIWGPEWGRRCRKNPIIMRAWQKRPAIGAEFSKVVAGSRLNLNLIDPSNYPAANMRFFEILMAGGLQVCSACPEMESEFRHGEHIFYYQQEEELPDLIRMLLHDERRRREVAAAAHEKVLAQHQYKHRAQAILAEFGLAA